MADELFLRKENLPLLITYRINADIQVRYRLNFKCDNGTDSARNAMSVMNCKIFLVATGNGERRGGGIINIDTTPLYF